MRRPYYLTFQATWDPHSQFSFSVEAPISYQWPVVHSAFAQAAPFQWDKPFPQLLLGEISSIAVIEIGIHRAVVIWHIEHQDGGEDCIWDQDVEGDAHEEEYKLVPVTDSDVTHTLSVKLQRISVTVTLVWIGKILFGCNCRGLSL